MCLLDFQVICFCSPEVISVRYKDTVMQYDVHWNDRVIDLKKKVLKNENLHTDCVDIIYHGESLSDVATLDIVGVFDTEDTPLLELHKR